MNELLKDVAFGAIGYVVGRKVSSKTYDKSNEYNFIENLHSYIDDYARRHGIYTTNNEFARKLHEIAKSYEQ